MKRDKLSFLLRQGIGSDHRRTEQCPEAIEIAAFVDGGLGAEEIRDTRTHVAGCDFCLARVGFLTRLKDTEIPELPSDLLARVRDLSKQGRTSTFSREWRWAAAAALVLLVFSVGQWRETESPDEAPSAVRNSVELLQPPEILWPREGALIAPDQLELRWTEVPNAIFYEIQLVTADGDRVWDGRVETERQQIPSDLQITAGQQLFVWVRAHLREGKTLQSGIVGFHLGSRGTTPE